MQRQIGRLCGGAVSPITTRLHLAPPDRFGMVRLALWLYFRSPTFLRNVREILAERGSDVHHETVWLLGKQFPAIDPALNKQILEVAQRQRRPHIHRAHAPVHLGRRVEAAKRAGSLSHCRVLPAPCADGNFSLTTPAQRSTRLAGSNAISKPRCQTRFTQGPAKFKEAS